MMHEYYFERMNVWKASRFLVKEVYTTTGNFPKEEEYHLKSQIRRSASSVKSNIAEGQARATKRDQARFTNLSYSSLVELLNHLITAYDLGYIDEKWLNRTRLRIDAIARQLIALKKVQLR